MKTIIPINVTEDGCAYGVKASYFKNASLTTLTQGGTHFPCTGVIEKTDMAKHYKIRKLTPTECFRLMGVRDDDIKKIRDSKISDTAQYKLAGNSIVCDVLMGIFTQMFRKDTDAFF